MLNHKNGPNGQREVGAARLRGKSLPSQVLARCSTKAKLNDRMWGVNLPVGLRVIVSKM